MIKIELDKIGKILEGDDAGQYIRIEHDPDDTGGYYIYQSTVKDFSSDETFDSWVENKNELEAFFSESNWVIDWNIALNS